MTNFGALIANERVVGRPKDLALIAALELMRDTLVTR